MAKETLTLRITAERLGTISQITGFLEDFEKAYNSLYAFDLLVESLVQRHERQVKESIDWLNYSNNSKIDLFREYPYGMVYYETLLNYSLKINAGNLVEFQKKIEIAKIIAPEDQLIISKVNIQSMGFWEAIGNLGPLKQIREFLKDCHERKKDKKFRNRQEEESKDVQIGKEKNELVLQQIDILKKLGYSDIEIRQIVTTMVFEPLKQLSKHQNNGQIGPPE